MSQVTLMNPGNRNTRNAASALVAVLIAALAGCASMNTAEVPERVVQKRAEQRWASLVAGQFDKAYEYFTPGYRAVMSPERYRGSFGNAGRWQNAEVIGVQCEPEKCEVRVKLQMKLAVPGIPVVTPEVTETWLREGGQWWLYQKL